jgi:predicted Zn-dependent protease
MARFFQKLDAEGGSRAPQFFSDHPNPGNREKAIEQETQKLAQQPYGFQTGQFQRMKRIVAKIREPKRRTQPQQSPPQQSQPQQ